MRLRPRRSARELSTRSSAARAATTSRSADSSAASAVAIRQLVLADAEAGMSDSSIVSYLQSRYPGIALRPPASGLEGLVWFAPLVAFALAICVIGAVFWRRQHAATPAVPADDDRKLVADALRASQSGARL